ncbi:hypothetical protein A2164_01430 [Candidatus Curtissbacteria bacterium RBG_13_35_7]|uniref:GtrA/DPMS transmembrane domain-containing protein n=1 Tax=Candidatus Curtissbacteria bacterium RBG_13_35_7 TaxID=1797705 RepID=A0A1F5G4R6_9BACT|nr:MAG: hypothetical protein A2164_01430 [Candidatus Curtissbacteria bacterium RBG_13_35_7]
MLKSDLSYAAVAAYLTSIFILPTLINTEYLDKLPMPYVLLFIGYPLVVIIGMIIASYISKKLAIIWQVAKFALVGVLNTAIDFGIYNFLIFISNITQDAGIAVINMLSFSTSVINSYFWNRKWVFKGAKQGNFFIFVTIALIGLTINTTIVWGLTTIVDPLFGMDKKLWANVAKALATSISMIWNFLGYKMIVFKK